MVERVARTIAGSNDETYGLRPIDETWRLFVVEARAAIAAMREPTEGMLDAAWATRHEPYEPPHPRDVYVDMIDAALKGDNNA
jgi:hypothetical protein